MPFALSIGTDIHRPNVKTSHVSQFDPHGTLSGVRCDPKNTPTFPQSSTFDH